MTALLAYKLYRILPRVYKLELQRPCQALFQRVGRHETRGHRLGGIELGGGAELLYADGGGGLTLNYSLTTRTFSLAIVSFDAATSVWNFS